MPKASGNSAKKPKKRSNNKTSSDIPSSYAEKPTEQLKEDLSKVMEQLSVTIDNSRKNPPSLSDMPIDVVCSIIERSKYKEQLKLRKVSKSLRALVDKQKPACESVKFDCCDGTIGIRFDSHWVVYTDEEDMNVGDGILVKRDDFKKVAFDDLASTLKNPKLQLEEFIVVDNVFKKEVVKEYSNKIRNILKSLNHKLSVKKFATDLPFPSSLLSLLPYLKPGVLERIMLMLWEEADFYINSTEMDQLALLDQWKQAKEIELLDSVDRFPMKYAAHFKRVIITETFIEKHNFARIRKFISQLDNIEQFTFVCKKGAQFLEKPISSNTTEAVYKYIIPDSDYFLQFRIPANSPDDVEITKKKK